MFLYIVYIFIGFYLLIKGADFLVDGASNLAKRFYIPTIISLQKYENTYNFTYSNFICFFLNITQKNNKFCNWNIYARING